MEHQINKQIRDSEVRVINIDGTQSVMPTWQAVQLANNQGLDLVRMNSEKPPVCRVMDYGKWVYQKQKNEKPQKKVLLKELQFRPNTGQHDIETKVRHAKRFLEDGHKVKLTLRMSGRELQHKDIGYKVLQDVVTQIGGLGKTETPIKSDGKAIFVLISPTT
jgi:translation initiation factor IF-3